MRSSKKVLSFILVLMLLITMVGCGDKAADNLEKVDKVVTIRMVESLTSPARTAILNEIIGKFEDKNKDIKVELISPPLENADDKINQMLMAKQPLDIVEVRDHTVKQFLNNNYLENLDTYMENWDGMDKLVDMAKVKAKEVGGNSYLIPYGFYIRCLYYRADWFKEKGLEPPKTWQELYDIGKQLTDPPKNRYGYSFRGGPNGQSYATMVIHDTIGDDIDISSAIYTKDGDTIFDRKEAIDALEFYKKMYNDISPKDSISWGFAEMVENFYSGVTAMLIQDPEVIATCQEKMEHGTWATAPLPIGPSGKSYSPAGYAGWGMTSYSEHKEETWRFLSFLLNEENSTYFCKKNSMIPIYKTASEDDFFKTEPYKAYMAMSAEPDKYVGVTMPFDSKGWGPFIKKCDQDLQKMLLNQMTTQDAAKSWSEYWHKEKENK
jgi:multiple sugar transport system substrate-binding protein